MSGDNNLSNKFSLSVKGFSKVSNAGGLGLVPLKEALINEVREFFKSN